MDNKAIEIHQHENQGKASSPRKNRFSPAYLWKRVILLAVIGLLVGCSFTKAVPTPTEAVQVTEEPSPVVTENVEATQWAAETQAAEGTQQALFAAVTEAAMKAETQAAINATATYVAPVIHELPSYGVNTSTGQLAWIHDPLSLSVDGYHAGESANDFASLSVKDFVVSADISWDSEYSTSGCGFAVRSDGNKEAPNEYMILLARSTDGHIYFKTFANGKVANYSDLYANLIDVDFDWENGATNRLAVVVKGNKIRIYTNKNFIGEVDITTPPPANPILPPHPIKPSSPSSDLTGQDLKEAQHAYQIMMDEYRDEIAKYNEQVSKLNAEHGAILSAYSSSNTVFDEGFVGLLAYSFSGAIHCNFDNAWLYIIE